MRMILILTVVLWSSTIVFSCSALAKANNNDGAATNIMENLAQHMATVAEQLSAELLAKTETTLQTLLENMELLVKSALQQLKQPFDDLQKKISSECQPQNKLQQLEQQIDSDLAKCTQQMQEIFKSFEQDSMAFNATLGETIKEIIDLPQKCQSSGSGLDFSSLINCYIENIATLNEQATNIYGNASEAVIHARQLGETALQEGRACSKQVITATENSFNEIVSACSQIVNQ